MATELVLDLNNVSTYDTVDTRTYGQRVTFDVDVVVSSIVLWSAGYDGAYCYPRIYKTSDGTKVASGGVTYQNSTKTICPLSSSVTLKAGTNYTLAIYNSSTLSFFYKYYEAGTDYSESYTANGMTITKAYGHMMYSENDGNPGSIYNSNFSHFNIGVEATIPNTPPNAPTIVSPKGTSTSPELISLNSLGDILLDWTFSDPDSGDSQSAYEVDLYDGTTAVWGSGKVSSTATATGIPSTIALAWDKTYNWRVRTWDSAGVVGAFSSYNYFTTNKKPTTSNQNPSGTSTKPTRASLSPRLSWDFVDTAVDSQSAFRVVIKNDTLTTTIHDTAKVTSSNKYYDIPSTLLSPNTKYAWYVYVYDKHGIISGVTTQFFVTFTPLSTVALPYPNDFQRSENLEYLRKRANDFRSSNGLTSKTWTDTTIIKGVTPIKAVHWNEIEDAILEVYTSLSQPFTTSTVQEQFQETIEAKTRRFPIQALSERINGIGKGLLNN